MAANSIVPMVGQTYIVSGEGTGGIKLDEVTEHFDMLNNSGTNLIILDGITYEDRDVVLPVVALDNKRILYSFGQNFGAAEIVGTIYNGCNDSPLFIGMNTLDVAFENVRVSASKIPVNLSVVGGFKAKVYIVALSFMQADPAMQSIKFKINCVVAPVANKN